MSFGSVMLVAFATFALLYFVYSGGRAVGMLEYAAAHRCEAAK